MVRQVVVGFQSPGWGLWRPGSDTASAPPSLAARGTEQPTLCGHCALGSTSLQQPQAQGQVGPEIPTHPAPGKDALPPVSLRLEGLGLPPLFPKPPLLLTTLTCPCIRERVTNSLFLPQILT